MKTDLIKSALHTLEIAVVGGIALVVLYMFKDNADVSSAVKDAIVNILPVAGAAFVAKLNRTTDKTPGGDYVNEIK